MSPSVAQSLSVTLPATPSFSFLLPCSPSLPLSASPSRPFSPLCSCFYSPCHAFLITPPHSGFPPTHCLLPLPLSPPPTDPPFPLYFYWFPIVPAPLFFSLGGSLSTPTLSSCPQTPLCASNPPPPGRVLEMGGDAPGARGKSGPETRWERLCGQSWPPQA